MAGKEVAAELASVVVHMTGQSLNRLTLVAMRRMTTIRIRLDSEDQMKRVTGIGGIFFSAKDPQALCAWYKRHLGIDVQDWGGTAFYLDRC